jgi:hypothetical protein
MSNTTAPMRKNMVPIIKLKGFVDADGLIAGSASTQGASHIILLLSDLTLIECLTSEQSRREAERNLIANRCERE